MTRRCPAGARLRRLAAMVTVTAVSLAACGAPAGDPVVSTTAGEESSTADTTASSTSTSLADETAEQDATTTTTFAQPTTAPEGLEAFGTGVAVVPAGPISVLVADDVDLQRRGLMGVEDLAGWDGMWFAFDEDRDGGFWMKDTILPLSIAWIDSSGAVVAIADMEPCPEEPCITYQPGAIYRFALEVEQGRLDELGIVIGAAVVAPT